jgi:CRISPR-associated protein Csc3
MGDWKAALYVQMVEEYLLSSAEDFLGKDKGDMSYARDLTEMYRKFYRAEKLNSNGILRPLMVASKAMLDADPRLFDSDEALVEAVQGKLRSFIENVSLDRADGRLPKGSTHESREQDIAAFSRYIVEDIYRGAFGGDLAAFRGKQLNLLKNACEALYLDMWRKERADQRVESADDESTTEKE